MRIHARYLRDVELVAETLIFFRSPDIIPTNGRHFKVRDRATDTLIEGRFKVHRRRRETRPHGIIEFEAERMGFAGVTRFNSWYNGAFPDWEVRYAYVVEYIPLNSMSPDELAETYE